MAVLVYLVLFLALTGYSSAAYCVCKDGLSDQALQKSLDYACGAGADCTPIVQNGACYSPNTVKNHCDYAVNSYYQKKSQAQGSCDFSGTATVTQTAPTGSSTTCVYPSSSQTGTTPSTTPTGTTPSTTPTGTTPSTTPTGTTPSTTTPSTTTPTTTTPTGTTPSSVFGTGISPSGTTTTGINDSSAPVPLITRCTSLFFSLGLTLWLVLLWA
ncbi:PLASMODESMATA CALLOSE-BINDING PROTEIN 3 [Quercus robur]|uniref:PLASMODESMATA CALLOSE-BINDING PROTEIN 3 n=1 Tax=Quercus robur TaxID=38942 RepID=UPI0021637A8A|nr:PLASMODESMATA CALLOSE-BINDING PROTEIN 3 [Quercus robur]